MKDPRFTLTQGEGYIVLENFIPSWLIASFKKRMMDLYPVRAVGTDKSYAERDAIKNLADISVWWSQKVDDFDEVKAIKRLVDPVITQNFTNMVSYVTDTVTINPYSKYFNPHVDTPHRFKQWNYDPRLLGIQCIVTLDDTNKDNAATGLVPFSQKRNFDIGQCYQGMYDRWFMENVKQHNMPAGTLLIYNCRILHSSMPNNTAHSRPALLMNYLDNSIMNDVSKVDNVWSSNV